MTDCPNMSKCSFYKAYEEAEKLKGVREEIIKATLSGFVKRYCQGPKQDECVRKKVSKALGGPEHVPKNMMPNGTPIPGTGESSEWPEDVKRVLRSLGQ